MRPLGNRSGDGARLCDALLGIEPVRVLPAPIPVGGRGAFRFAVDEMFRQMEREFWEAWYRGELLGWCPPYGANSGEFGR